MTPRLRIHWLMAIVAIVAIDFEAIRTSVELNRGRDDNLPFFLGSGVLPMANLLAFALWAGRRRPGVRPFVRGFVASGLMASGLFVLLAAFFPDETLMPYLGPVIGPLHEAIGYDRPNLLIPATTIVSIMLLGWPQVAIALMGGFLNRTFRVTINVTRRATRPMPL